MQRNIYLIKKPLEEALHIFLKKIKLPDPPPLENIKVEDSLDRITGRPVFAKTSSPFYHSAAMDGIAVKAEDTFGVNEVNPKRLQIGEEANWINTGSPLPDDKNAVIMIEDVHQIDNKTVEINSAIHPWKNVRVTGEDIVATELILPENHQIRPFDMGAILAGGVTAIMVKKKPSVVIIPTGSELIQPSEPLQKGKIIEFNSHILGAFVTQWGGEFVQHPIIKDEYNKIKEAVLKASKKYDLIIVNAGSSAGAKDYTASIVKDLGELLVHGVNIMPGKPTILGIINEKPVIGIPGYPVSAVISFEQFAKPVISKFLGINPPERRKIKVTMSKKTPSKLGNEEFLRVKMGKVGDKIMATPLTRGAGVITSLTKADGIVRIPALSEGVNAGETVEAELIRTEEEIKNTIVIIGSHDMTLDILGNELKRKYPKLSVSSANVGSLGGLMALKKGECHLAGAHLLDPETGEYNFAYIKKYLDNQEVIVLNLVYREQGLIVQPGNPKNISSLSDLVNDGLTFVNRQRGAGTRILLDYKLNKLGIDSSKIKGYEREEFTHMSVAVAVASGLADVGLGIAASAKALNLDFIPIEKERYDLIIPQKHYETPMLQSLLEIINSEEFKKKIKELGGYDTKDMGKIMKM